MNANTLFVEFLSRTGREQTRASREMGLAETIISGLVSGRRKFTYHYLGKFVATYADPQSLSFNTAAYDVAAKIGRALRDKQPA